MSTPPGWSVIRLRRDGMRPLRFTGQLIARHDARPPAAALWHELALYRGPAAATGVEIVAWAARADGDFRARCHAALFDRQDDALAFLEGHDAMADICPGLTAPACGGGAAESLLAAAALRAFCQDAVCRYRAAVGAFLAGVAAKESPSPFLFGARS
jgi:hypothetical protein